MIVLKKIDVIGQIGLIAFAIFIAILPATHGNLFFGYFLVGGWQLISAIIHCMCRDVLLLTSSRCWYNWSLVIVAVLGFCCVVANPLLIFYLYGLLLFSPIMAICYLLLSNHELKVWQAKALIHLK